MRLHALGLGLLLLSAFAMAGCAGPKPPEETGTTVEMKGFEFVPEEITVKKGTKVFWRNRDGAYHTVDSNETGGPLKSGNVNSGQSYSYTFDTAGTFLYHCVPHKSSMYGKVIVTD